MIRFLKLFTEIPVEEVDGWTCREGAELNELKVRLADEATTMLHGPGEIPIMQSIYSISSCMNPPSPSKSVWKPFIRGLPPFLERLAATSKRYRKLD